MISKSTYHIIRKIHLYASLSTAILFIMYLVTSYMMIYHSWFNPEVKAETIINVQNPGIDPSGNEWRLFRREHQITGRMYNEYTNTSGDLIQEYASVGSETRVRIPSGTKPIELRVREKNLSAKLIGYHRLRGYGGPIQYNIYAFFLDLTGLSLILFAVTGIVLWLKLLNNNRIAWAILILGFIYVSAVMAFLLYG